MTQILPATALLQLYPTSRLTIRALFLLLFLLISIDGIAQFSETWVTQPLKSGAESVEEFKAQAIDQNSNLISVTYNGRYRENTRIALFKHNQNGQRLWTSSYSDGTSQWDTPSAIKLDNAGNIYLLGWSQFNETDGNSFLAKFTAAGEQVWTKPLGRNPGAEGFAVAANGEVFLIDTDKVGEGEETRIKKLDTAGNIVWSKDFIGTDGKGGNPRAMALDDSGNLYVGGMLYEQPGYPTPPYYVARLVKYSTQSGAKTFTGEYPSPDIQTQTDSEYMDQVLIAPSGNVYLVSQRSGLYVYQVVLYKVNSGGNLGWVTAVGDTDESIHMKSVLSAEEQITLLSMERKYRDVPDYFLTAFTSEGQRQYYHTYNKYSSQTFNIRRVVPDDIGLSPDGNVALIGSRDYIERPPAWFLPPIEIEPARETIITYSTTGEELWKETSGNDAGARSHGMALDYLSAGSFYLAGRQVSDKQLVAARYTNCGGFTVTAGENKAICQGSEVRLEASASSAVTSYSWSPAIGLSSASVANPVASPTQTTTYTVTAINADGCTATAQVTVTVNPVPATSINVTDPTTFCQGGSVKLNVNPDAGITAYQWLRNGQEISGATTNSYTASMAGAYTVRTSNGNCSSTSSPIEVTVVSSITNNAILQDQTICEGASAAVIAGETPAGGTGNYTYQWQRSTNGTDFSNIAGATGKNYEAGQLQSTTWFRRTVTSGVCSSVSEQVKITVTPVPVAGISTTGSTSLCPGGSVQLSANPGAGIMGYQWLRNGEEISGATAATYLANTSGAYRVRTTNGSCSSTSPVIEVSVQAAITDNLIFRDQAICSGTGAAAIVGETPKGGNGNYTYQWQRSTTGSDFTNIAGSNSKNFEPGNLQTTTWFRRIVASGGCSTTSEAIKITVNPLPNVSLSSFEQTCQTATAFTLTGGSPAGGTYSGNGVVNGMFYPAEAGPGTHTITYTYTIPEGCSASAVQSIVVTNCSVTSIDPNKLKLPVSIYPNPTNGKVYIEIEMPHSTAVELSLTDVSGRVIYSKTYQRQLKLTETLQIGNQPRGLYFLQIKTDEGTLQRKIVLN